MKRIALAVAVGLLVPSLTTAQIPLGPTITVDPTGYEPSVAVNDDGDFMVVWEGTSDELRGQLFDSDGTPLAGGFDVGSPGVNVDGYPYQGPLDVSTDGTDFVVAWSGYEDIVSACLSLDCIFTRSVSSTGTLGTEFVIEDPTPAEQAKHPRVSGNGIGTFVTVWEGFDSDDEGVQGRTLASDGSGVSSQFQANETEAFYQGDNGYSDVAGGPTGDFVVAWTADYQGIAFRRFDSTGAPLASESVAAGYAGIFPRDPKVAYASNGNFMVVWQTTYISETIQGRAFDSSGTPLTPAFDIATGGNLYQPNVAGYPDDDFVVVWQGDDGVQGQRFDSAGALIGPVFTASDYGKHPGVDTDTDGNFTVVWTAYDAVYAQRFAARIPQPLAGRKLKIKNKVPDVPEKNKAQWVVKDASLDLPVPGSAGDPTCQGDPAGTIKASLRFHSIDSGHDTGTIDLACERWSTSGSGSSLSYEYKNPKLLNSPCKVVKLKQAKQIRATCFGKNPLFPLDYDLEVGTAEGTVHTTLIMGDRQYCTSIPTFKTKDGSDGKTFLGKDGPAPASCP